MSDPGRRPIPQRDTNWARFLARVVARVGITPNQISIFSVICSAMSCACFCRADGDWREGYALAGLFILLRLLCNMIDGMVAVEHNKKSPSGAIFNELPDRFSDMLSIMGAAYAAELMQLGWLACVWAVMTAYVRILCSGAGAPADFGGPMAKQQRMFCLIVGAVCSAGYPDLAIPFLGTALAVIAAGSVATTARRSISAIRYLENRGE